MTTPPDDIRVAYPFSLIAGGVRGDDDIPRSGPLAAHYAGVAFLRRAYLAKDESFFASFLRDGEIQWAAVTVRRGELVFRNRSGAAVVRGRCGNRLEKRLPPNAKTFVLPPVAELPVVAWVESPEIPAPDLTTGILTAPFPPIAPPDAELPGAHTRLAPPPPIAPVPLPTSLPPLVVDTPGFPPLAPPILLFPRGGRLPSAAAPLRGIPEPGAFRLVALGLIALLIFALLAG